MNFAEAIRNEERKKFTENGATAYNSTTDACLDMFATVGSLRSRNESDLRRIFDEAYKEDKLLATKILFYARDIREGCGEREIFRVLIKYLAEYHKEAIRPNLALVGEYGRFDDLYALVGTALEKEMWAVMKNQLESDIKNYKAGKPISLLAKWVKTADASSKNTRQLGIKTAINLGYKVYDFKRIIRELRAYLEVVEVYMSTGKWTSIKYSSVPSNAMKRYRKAFLKHDEDRFNSFVNKAVNGDEKINSATLYPYDIVMGITNFNYGYGSTLNIRDDKVLEAQWRQLPNYVEAGTNALVVADLSGSMTCQNGMPMASSIALSIYFAERNVGAYKDMFIPFSSDAHIVKIKGDTLADKINYVFKANRGYWGSTNLEAAFKKVLKVAVDNNVPRDEMVKSLIVISDMEIDGATSDSRAWSFYDKMREMYEKAGYDIPNIVFWNVAARNDTFHADKDRKGVQLVSGQSINTFKNLMGSVGMTPMEMMHKVIDSPRYERITIE